jgi:hypothetical protein
MPLRHHITPERDACPRHIRGGATATAGFSAWRAASAKLALLVLAALILRAPAAHATTYKWVDDQGVVHYTDKLPPEAINKGNV